jgi:hypothetical protein
VAGLDRCQLSMNYFGCYDAVVSRHNLGLRRDHF